MSGIDEQCIIPICPICGELPHNWHIKTTGGYNCQRGLDAWIFPEKRLAKELLDKASQIRVPVMMSPVPNTKDDLLCVLDNIIEIICTTCHIRQESDKILMEKIKKVLIKAYEKAGDDAFLKLKV